PRPAGGERARGSGGAGRRPAFGPRSARAPASGPPGAGTARRSRCRHLPATPRGASASPGDAALAVAVRPSARPTPDQAPAESIGTPRALRQSELVDTCRAGGRRTPGYDPPLWLRPHAAPRSSNVLG